MAQTTTIDDREDILETANPNWQVEVIAFIHAQPDQAFRDRNDLEDYRDLPALPALLTANQPVRPSAISAFNSNASEQIFATQTMADAWRRIDESYQRIGYFRWQQPTGRGSLRRLHDDQPLSADDSLSLGPHFELDGQIRVTTATIGFASPQLTHRTPLLVTPGANAAEGSTSSQLWRTLKLEQQRRIQPGRVEYFDSAGIGLLILITPPQRDEVVD